MWGAPTEQPDHATLACRAALDMLEKLPEMVERWKPDPWRGVRPGHRPEHRHGTGRQHRHDPQVQVWPARDHGQPGQPGPGSDQALQGPTDHHRGRPRPPSTTASPPGRLGKVRVVNIVEPVDLYELVPCDYPDWHDLAERIRVGPDHFEAGHFRPAAGSWATSRSTTRATAPPSSSWPGSSTPSAKVPCPSTRSGPSIRSP